MSNNRKNKNKAGQRSPGGPALKINRETRRSQAVHSDLFKTSLAEYQRWIGWSKNPAPADYTGIAHQHFFRTFNSDGQEQKRTTPIASHFHDVAVVMDPATDNKKPLLDANGRLQITIGPALQMMKIGKGATARIVPSKIPLYTEVRPDGEGGHVEVQVYDEHKHTAKYLRSDQVDIREMSGDAQAVIDMIGSNVIDAAGKLVPIPVMPAGVGNTENYGQPR